MLRRLTAETLRMTMSSATCLKTQFSLYDSPQDQFSASGYPPTDVAEYCHPGNQLTCFLSLFFFFPFPVLQWVIGGRVHRGKGRGDLRPQWSHQQHQGYRGPCWTGLKHTNRWETNAHVKKGSRLNSVYTHFVSLISFMLDIVTLWAPFAEVSSRVFVIFVPEEVTQREVNVWTPHSLAAQLDFPFPVFNLSFYIPSCFSHRREKSAVLGAGYFLGRECL